MKKRIFGKKLGRSAGSRRALKRSLISALVLHGSIQTTKSKSKFITRDIDKIINIAKKGDLAAFRRVYATTGNERQITGKLIELSQAFSDRVGGYTKLVPMGLRKGDNTQMVRIEWAKQIVAKDIETKDAKKGKNPKSDKKPDTKRAVRRKLTTTRTKLETKKNKKSKE